MIKKIITALVVASALSAGSMAQTSAASKPGPEKPPELLPGLDKQIIDQKKPLTSQTSYWSTLRPGTVSYRVFAKQMTNVPLACKKGPPQVAKR